MGLYLRDLYPTLEGNLNMPSCPCLGGSLCGSRRSLRDMQEYPKPALPLQAINQSTTPLGDNRLVTAGASNRLAAVAHLRSTPHIERAATVRDQDYQIVQWRR